MTILDKLINAEFLHNPLESFNCYAPGPGCDGLPPPTCDAGPLPPGCDCIFHTSFDMERYNLYASDQNRIDSFWDKLLPR